MAVCVWCVCVNITQTSLEFHKMRSATVANCLKVASSPLHTPPLPHPPTAHPPPHSLFLLHSNLIECQPEVHLSSAEGYESRQ